MRCTAFAISMMACSSAAVLGGAPSLSELPEGDRLHVSYHSRGCFHDRQYEIDFEKRDGLTARSSTSAVTLSRREIAGLERLIEYYRSRPVGGCTTQDDITLTQFRGAVEIASEHYVDGSCATYRMHGITQVYDIAKKLGMERDANK